LRREGSDRKPIVRRSLKGKGASWFWVRDGGKENQIVGIGNRRLFYGGEDVNGKISVKRLIPID